MHSNTAVAHDSPWNCLRQRFSPIGLIPHDVGGSGDCFFKSVSHQLYGNADLHVKISMAGISHLHNKFHRILNFITSLKLLNLLYVIHVTIKKLVSLIKYLNYIVNEKNDMFYCIFPCNYSSDYHSGYC